jgi:phosphatidylserine/phosphatidylglycerophosphate/cardiolipin synthase-like enzyme
VSLDPLVASASDHDKIVVVDGTQSVMGGRNIETKYFAHPDDLGEAFNDVDVLLESPAIGKALTDVFETTWDSDRVTDVAGEPDGRCQAAMRAADEAMDAWVEGRPFPDDSVPEHVPGVPWIAELQRLPRLRGSGARPAGRRTPVEAQVVDSLPRAGSPDDPVTRGLLRLFGAATDSVLVESPYVVLTNDAAETLEAAGRQGVKVTLLTNSPESTDNALSQTYFMEQWPRLLAAAPDLRLFAIGTRHNLHSKVAVFDDRAVVVGSYNLDPFSMLISGEVVVALWSPEFARRVAARPRRMIAAGPPQVYEYTIERDAAGRPVHTATGEVAIGFGPADHTDVAQWPRPGVRVAFVRAVPWLFGLPSFF